MWDRYDGTRRNPFNPNEGHSHLPRLHLTLECHAGHLDVYAVHLDGSAFPLDAQVVIPSKPLAIPAP